MKYLYKSFLLCILLWYTPATIWAQISEGGLPPSFQYASTGMRTASLPQKIDIPFSVDDLKAEDLVQEEITPPRVSVLIHANLNPENAGHWTTLSNGDRVWQLNITAQGAIATMLYYSKFSIPEGGKLFVYNNDKTHIIGAYTHKTNPTKGRFCTEFVAGDNIWIEYVAPSNNTQEKPDIQIEEVGYGYQNLQIRATGVDASANCMVDINCSEGNEWQTQKQGVCHTLLRVGSSNYYCTGSLVNNTKQDYKPYILTAHHCVSEGSGIADYAQSIFYFNYEKTTCDGNVLADRKSMVGSEMKAFSPIRGGSDGLLLLLKENIPTSYKTYFNGWNRQDIAPTKGVGIHHPAGDVKKISTFTTAPATSTWLSNDNSGRQMKGAKDMHWNVIFRKTTNGHSVTEGGSSGSPLFNQDKLVVATLSGGDSNCYGLIEGSNLYGKLYAHWDKYGTNAAENHMSTYLDPEKTGVEILNGLNCVADNSAPLNVKAVKNEATRSIALTWKAPLDIAVEKYIIIRNHLTIDTVAANQLVFNESNLPDGGYKYSVKTIYRTPQGVEESTATQTEKIDFISYAPPSNIRSFALDNQTIKTIWDTPTYRQFLHWCGLNPTLTISYDTPQQQMFFGHLWEASNIVTLNKRTIESVTFIPLEGVQYTIMLNQGDRYYAQDITNSTIDQFNEFQLKEPFVIDATKDLLVAVRVKGITAKKSLFVLDNQPSIANKGNLVSSNGIKWETLLIKDKNKMHNLIIGFTVNANIGTLATYTSRGTTAERTMVSNLSQNISSTNSNVSSQLSLRSNNLNIVTLPYAFPTLSGYKALRNGEEMMTQTITNNFISDTNLNTLLPYQYTLQSVYGDKLSELSKPVTTSIADFQVNGTSLRPNRETGEYEFFYPCNENQINIKAQGTPNAYAQINNVKYPLEITWSSDQTEVLPINIHSANGAIENTHYLKIDRATQDECDDVSLKSILVNNQEFYGNTTGNLYKAMVDCDTPEIDLQVEAFGGTKIFINEVEKINEKIALLPDETEKNISLQVISRNGAKRGSYQLNVRKLSEEIVIQRWNDVLAVVNNPANNGDLHFLKFEWFRNGILLEGETNSYIQIDPITDATAVYTARLTTQNGIKLLSCESSIQANKNRITVYPNNLKAGDEITIITSGDETEETAITVISSSGSVLNSLVTSQRKTQLSAPYTPGSYIVRVQVKEGYTKEFKIIVQ